MNRRQRFAHRLWFGSALLARRLAERSAGWVRKGPTRTHRIVRLLLLLLGAYLVARMIRAAPGALWVIIPVWCWRAIRAQPPPVEDREQPPVEGSADAVRALLTDLIGDRPGVHLSTVLDHLQQRGQGEGWEVADLRARLTALGVPVRRSVKVARRVAYGVHRDDLTAPSPTHATETAA